MCCQVGFLHSISDLMGVNSNWSHNNGNVLEVQGSINPATGADCSNDSQKRKLFHSKQCESVNHSELVHLILGDSRITDVIIGDNFVGLRNS